MSRRTLLAGVLGLLVPLPLVVLLAISMKSLVAGSARPEQRSLVPMLTSEERHRLLSYERDCSTDEDCDSPLRCFFNERIGRRFCTDSRCMTDLQCAEDFACRTFDVGNGKEQIRGCALVGIRKEGESCRRLPDTREQGCERGLLCQTRCGRPCVLDEPSSCPVGFFCSDGPDGPSCLPRCEGLTCPEGQRCVGVAADVSICASIHGPDCERTPCPEGQECEVYGDLPPANEVWMECLSGCGGREDPPCPEGTACYLFQCRKACDPEGPPVCGSGFACRRSHSSQPWVCLPSTRTE